MSLRSNFGYVLDLFEISKIQINDPRSCQSLIQRVRDGGEVFGSAEGVDHRVNPRLRVSAIGRTTLSVVGFLTIILIFICRKGDNHGYIM